MKSTYEGAALASDAKQATKAEARSCATLRFNGTGSRAVPWFEDPHHFRKVRIWKTPEISSKMRTLFEGAHQKVRIFEGAYKWLAVRTWRGSAQLATVSELGAVAQSVRAADS